MHKFGHYGWRPDLPDIRDFYHPLPSLGMVQALPHKVDLRPFDTKVFDQGQLGSCTANAISSAFAFEQKKQGLSLITPSRLFIYYNERVMEGTVNSDAGAMIRDGIKSVAKLGVVSETSWPYNTAKFTVKPGSKLYTRALKHQALKYQRVRQSLTAIKAVIAAGYPVVFGFTVYESFESDATARTGHMTMPEAGEQVLGGHAVKKVGYDDSIACWIVKNSWSRHWGAGGYFYMPYAYSQPDLCDDYWTIKLVEG